MSDLDSDFDIDDIASPDAPPPAVPSTPPEPAKQTAQKRQRPMNGIVLPLSVPAKKGYKGAYMRVALNARLLSRVLTEMRRVNKGLILDFDRRGSLVMRQQTSDRVMLVEMVLRRTAFHVFEMPTSQTLVIMPSSDFMNNVTSLKTEQFVTLYRELNIGEASPITFGVQTPSPNNPNRAMQKYGFGIKPAELENHEVMQAVPFESETEIVMPMKVFRNIIDFGQRNDAVDVAFMCSETSLLTSLQPKDSSIESASTETFFADCPGMSVNVRTKVSRVVYTQKLVELAVGLGDLSPTVYVAFGRAQPMVIRFDLMWGGEVVGQMTSWNMAHCDDY